MNAVILLLVQVVIVLLGAPLLQGVIKKMKSRLQGRQGPGLFQPYFDLWRLLRKDSVVSEHATWVFRSTPYIVFAGTVSASIFVPVWTVVSPLGFAGDAILVVYLLGLARFFEALAALDTGSSFGGMGSSREMALSSFAEPALLMVMFVVGLKANSLNFGEIVLSSFGAGYYGCLSLPNILVATGFFIVVIAETGRIPVDNPATHLELTMVHEAMILEYSGRGLALLEWAKAVKQFLFFSLLANIFFPMGLARDAEVPGVFYSTGIFFSKVVVLAFIMSWVETLNAKLRLFRVPKLLMASLCLSMMALVYIILVR